MVKNSSKCKQIEKKLALHVKNNHDNYVSVLFFRESMAMIITCILTSQTQFIIIFFIWDQTFAIFNEEIE